MCAKKTTWQRCEQEAKRKRKEERRLVRELTGEVVREARDNPEIPDPPSDPPDYLLARRPASAYVASPREWLWPGRIPIGQLTLLAGAADAGKSLAAIDLAARVTRGGPWPDGAEPPLEPANVLILSAEGDRLGTLLPRLAQARADLHRVYISDGLDGQKREGATFLHERLRLPDDLRRIRETVEEYFPTRLVIIDPLWAFCSGDRKQRAIAGAAFLAPLAELAAECETAILGITTLKRDRQAPEQYRIAETRALTSAARVAFGIVRHPRSDSRLLVSLRMNLGPRPADLEFNIAGGRIEWRSEPATFTAREVIAAEESVRNDYTETEEWLRTFLASGSRRFEDVISAAKACGFTVGTLRRAKSVLRVQSQRHGFNGDAHWAWSLNGPAEQKNARRFEN